MVRELLSRGFDVRVLVRDPSSLMARELRELGAALIRGDMNEPASLRKAMRGVHGVFSVQPVSKSDFGLEVRQGVRVIDAAKREGVAHMVYSSVGGAERASGVAHFESKWRIEEHLRMQGVPCTVLRPVSFMENFRALLRPKSVDGELVLRMALRPETRFQLIAIRDIAVFAAEAFERPNAFLNRSIELAGDAPTMLELASAFQRVTGVPTRFESLPISQLRIVNMEVAKMFEWLEQESHSADIPALRRLHPGLMTLDDWLQEFVVEVAAPVSRPQPIVRLLKW